MQLGRHLPEVLSRRRCCFRKLQVLLKTPPATFFFARQKLFHGLRINSYDNEIIYTRSELVGRSLCHARSRGVGFRSTQAFLRLCGVRKWWWSVAGTIQRWERWLRMRMSGAAQPIQVLFWATLARHARDGMRRPLGPTVARASLGHDLLDAPHRLVFYQPHHHQQAQRREPLTLLMISPTVLRSRVREAVSHPSQNNGVLKFCQRNRKWNQEATMVAKTGFVTALSVRLCARQGGVKKI